MEWTHLNNYLGYEICPFCIFLSNQNNYFKAKHCTCLALFLSWQSLKVLYFMKSFFQFGLWLVLLGLVGCKTDTNESASNTIVVRAHADLVGLNPVTQSGGNALRTLKLILPSLVDFDPVMATFTPVLIDELPQKDENTTNVTYSFRFRKEARWPDGSPITVDDYIFSLKVAFNRKIRGNSWTRALGIIEKVEVDSSDNLGCRVILKKDISNAMGYFAGFELLPAYNYDPKRLLAPFPLDSFMTVEAFDRLWTAHSEITEFAQSFSQEKYIRDPKSVVGAGPYRLDSWVTNEQIVLVKKKNYWAEGLKNITALLAANPDTIIHKIVEDEVATSLLVKNNKLDVVSSLSAVTFLKLRDNKDVAANYDFYTPNAPTTYAVYMNTQSPKLGKSVRNALARCIDLRQIMDVATSGLGKNVISPLSLESPYYNNDLKPIGKDLKSAKALLSDAGWVDVDGDGVLEKEINGQTLPLELIVVVGSNNAGKVIAPIIKASAEKIGIKINIVAASGREILSRLRSPKFEMMILGISVSPTDYEPYSSWHSDNAGKKGKNYARFASNEMDKVIDQLRLAASEEEKKELYRKFQEILYAEQPVLYLYSPVKTIIVHNRWEPLISSVRPGYFENAFRLKKN